MTLGLAVIRTGFETDSIGTDETGRSDETTRPDDGGLEGAATDATLVAFVLLFADADSAGADIGGGRETTELTTLDAVDTTADAEEFETDEFDTCTGLAEGSMGTDGEAMTGDIAWLAVLLDPDTIHQV